MNFQIRCKLNRKLWNNDVSFLFLVTEEYKDKSKSWPIWTKQELFPDVNYTITGYVTESPDKKKDQDGKAIYKANFNATQIVEEMPF